LALRRPEPIAFTETRSTGFHGHNAAGQSRIHECTGSGRVPIFVPTAGGLSGLFINVSDYSNVDFINSGAFGDAWRTVDAGTGCPLALKVVKRTMLTGDGIRNLGQDVEILASTR
jgi:hypothetical protein